MFKCREEKQKGVRKLKAQVKHRYLENLPKYSNKVLVCVERLTILFTNMFFFIHSQDMKMKCKAVSQLGLNKVTYLGATSVEEEVEGLWYNDIYREMCVCVCVFVD